LLSALLSLALLAAVVVEPDGTGVAEPLLAAMQAAEAAVHVEMYLLTNETYLEALAVLHRRGVDVKVVLNRTFPPETPAAATNASSYATLARAGVPVRWAPTNTGFDSYTHAKTVVIDPGTQEAQAWIMTMNLDDSAPRANREYLVRDTTPADVAEAEEIFEADLVVAPSPENNAVTALLALVGGAGRSIEIEAEELDDDGVEASVFDALVAKAEAGVLVRVVLQDSSVAAQASAVRMLVTSGAQVAGYSRGAGRLDIHAKAIVVDGERAYVGSENLSGGSLGYNRELGVMFDDESAVATVRATIVGDFEGGAPYR
jgi:phosphatidylserine/phosphatidylglycerophosphate/cardiolipin synthase-like enzyme